MISPNWETGVLQDVLVSKGENRALGKGKDGALRQVVALRFPVEHMLTYQILGVTSAAK